MGITGLQTTIDENRRLTTENAALKARVAELEGIVRYQDAALKVLEKDGDDSLDWALRLESDRNAALDALHALAGWVDKIEEEFDLNGLKETLEGGWDAEGGEG